MNAAADGQLAEVDVGVGAGADLDAAIAEQAPHLIGHLNDDFEDAVLMVGRVLGGVTDAVRSTVTGLDRSGIELEVGTADATRAVRLDFDEPVTAAEELGPKLIGLAVKAREAAGEEASVGRLIEDAARIRTFVAQVAAVREVHPRLRLVTVQGDDLRTMADAGPDAFLYLLLPPPGRDQLTVDQSFTWDGYWKMPEEDRPVGAYYTVRRFRPEMGEVDLLMVLHGDAGPGSAWAGRAAPGDPVALWGPRTSFEPPEETDSYLLVADETGLPAAAAILERVPDGVPVKVVAEVDSPEERQELPDLPMVDVTWCYRHGAPAGTTTLLADAVQGMARPAGQLYVWGGGESRALPRIRKYVRNDWGLDRAQVSLVGYWRHADHDDAVGGDEDDAED
jgi:NADPH-dependent ferric siderophore reductase